MRLVEEGVHQEADHEASGDRAKHPPDVQHSAAGGRRGGEAKIYAGCTL